MNLNVLILPGDGIGTEVTCQAVRVLEHVAKTWNHTLHLTEGLLGGIAIHKTGTPFPEETARLAASAWRRRRTVRPGRAAWSGRRLLRRRRDEHAGPAALAG